VSKMITFSAIRIESFVGSMDGRRSQNRLHRERS
jgi:hypothetical protein